jgi:hypothetical protein
MGTKFCLFTLMKCNPIFEMPFSTGAIPEVLLFDRKNPRKWRSKPNMSTSLVIGLDFRGQTTTNPIDNPIPSHNTK